MGLADEFEYMSINDIMNMIESDKINVAVFED